MAVHASCSFRRAISLTGIALLTAACAACSSIGDPAGFSIVTQDAFDFKTCPEIIGVRNSMTAREKELTELVAKAESAPGGIIVSYAAYRTELTSVRAQKQAAERAARMHDCDAPTKPDAPKKP
jgi:recombinational DNA repair protein (RecF pathway)